MENIHKKQKVSERETLMAMTGGDPIGFFEHNIRREKESIAETIEKIVSEASPGGMAKTLEQMIYCFQVLGNETDVLIEGMTEDLWRLANLNTLLCRLASAKNAIKLYEMEIALLKAETDVQPSTSN